MYNDVGLVGCLFYGVSICCGGACGVMVIVAGSEHSDTSSNPERD